jgi:hypothetical protein
MPIPKEKKANRVRAGYCALCTRRAKVNVKTGSPYKHCEVHLKYFREYHKVWAQENPQTKTNRCSYCREVGCSRNRCPKLRRDQMAN